MTTEDDRGTVIIGAGPAGLACAWELGNRGRRAVVFEQDEVVGGISRTVSYKGYRFDIGGHRFFTKVPLVWRMWEEILDEEFLERPRLSRIYYQGKFFDYPLKPLNALVNLGPVETVRVGLSWAWAQAFPQREERTFEQWVVNRFGRRLYEIFFKTYTEKVWGTPCTEIGSDWAAQRIKNLDLVAALKDALLSSSGRSGRRGEVVSTLIDRFHYPRHGPGMMWEQCRDRLLETGIETVMTTRVERLHHESGRIVAATIRGTDGVERVEADHFVSSMPVPALVRSLDPAPPTEILEAAARLRFRDFLTVVLIVDQPDLFPDNWIYIHSPDVSLGRIQNFKNWSPEMVPDAGMTSLGLEYFVNEGDELWASSDEDLAELGRREVAHLGLIDPEDVVDATVVRMPKAYPVYDAAHREALPVVRDYLLGFPNLHAVGRNGQHRYNNQDHSMVTGVYAARNIDGAAHDLWAVNVEEEYHEEVREAADQRPTGDRLTPQPVAARGLEDRVREAFARYDPVALGGAVGLVAASGLLVATAILLLRPEEVKGPTLSLLGHYLVGYEVSWLGSVVGFIEAGLSGFVFGYVLARILNGFVAFVETALTRDLEMAKILE
jgi:protoporphyrinogen oxidase